ncbi:cupin fold metalloprotein, WbuC family [Rhodospirillaceae bacterium KN72]|uniref:Cupin fold metalloprotein, WbuC family n=1 Tax=Pacificispira spongiicola TaxID=2729598 RepID=A0A7Y0E3T5_9PROT|nr:WbuC family cupin fold metalloprotein [Pacificispira spongiicola]NMM46720.1 cupin fold metalloprotein, WbuC family [Pacificispira spongiicola]
MTEVFLNTDDIVEVTDAWIEKLKTAAAESPLKRSRLCLHLSPEDPVQEMIIALRQEILFRPHRHPNKSESFHMLEGSLYVLLFNDDGSVKRAIEMGPRGSGQVSCYRLCTSQWHAILPMTEVVVFHESTAGPFVPGDALFPDWAPSDQDALRAFLNNHLKQATGRSI